MIKLTDLVKELSLEKGHASGKSSADISIEGMIDLLSVKGMRQYDFENNDEANSLVQPLINDLLAKNQPIAEQGQYKLFFKKASGEHKFYLVDTKAPTVDMTFVGVMKLEPTYSSYTFNTQKAFELKTYQVHWSNVGIEYRGKGLGKVMYTLVYQHVSSLGAALASDSMLYEGSSGMWRSYMPSIAKYFGVIIEGVILPVTKEDVSDTSLVDKAGIDAFIAMENPPTLIRKISYNVKGLSFANGEYGIIEARYQSINDKLTLGYGDDVEETYFMNIVDDSSSLKELFKSLNETGVTSTGDLSSAGNPDQLKCVIFAFEDTLIVVKQVGGGLVAVTI